MTVRIEAGEIVKSALKGTKLYMRHIEVCDNMRLLFAKTVYADTKEELEIIDHENFVKE